MAQKHHGTTRHHLIPRSRREDLKRLLRIGDDEFKELIGKIDATREVNSMIHDCWHMLFSNYFAWEAIKQIKLWANDDLSGFRIFLDIKLRMAWYIVFGGEVSPKRAIELIKKDWWPEWERVSIGNAVKLGLFKP